MAASPLASNDKQTRTKTTDNLLILLTGATGYIGGRLLQLLEHRGYRVRCLARRPEFLRPKVAPSTEVVPGDVLDRRSVLVQRTPKGSSFLRDVHKIIGESVNPRKSAAKEGRRAAG